MFSAVFLGRTAFIAGVVLLANVGFVYCGWMFGHLGILDRVDSMIFVAPNFSHVVRWLQGLHRAGP